MILLGNHPFDAYFKALMAVTGTAAALLRERFPRSVLSRLQVDSTRLINTGFVDENLRESWSDVLILIDTSKNGKEHVIALIEHKSEPQRLTPLQLLKYQTRIYEAWANREENKGKRPPPILLLLIYHGKRRWNIPRSLRGWIDSHGLSGLSLLNFKYIFVDLGAIDDSALSNHPVLRAGLLALKYAQRYDEQDDAVLAVLKALVDAPSIRRHTFALLTRYRCKRVNIWHEARKLMPQEEHVIQTIGERMIEQGRLQGVAQGVAQEKVAVLERLLHRRFGSLPVAVEQRVRQAGAPALDAWLEQTLFARTLDEVFVQPRASM